LEKPPDEQHHLEMKKKIAWEYTDSSAQISLHLLLAMLCFCFFCFGWGIQSSAMGILVQTSKIIAS